MSRFREYFPRAKTIIGMIHLPPLPGYSDSPGIEYAIRHAAGDLHALEAAGVDGALIENEYDQPHRVEAAPETTAAMTRITRAVVQESDAARVGCEILLNDPKASLAVARMCILHQDRLLRRPDDSTGVRRVPHRSRRPPGLPVVNWGRQCAYPRGYPGQVCKHG